MRKLFIFSIILFSFNFTINAQYLVESAEGKGTILMPMNGLGVGFDVGKSELTVGINNYKKLIDSNERKFRNKYFLGLNLAVKNSEGLGNLFSSGDIVPSGNFLGFAGYSFDNFQTIAKKTSEIIKKTELELAGKALAREHYRKDVLGDIIVISEDEIDKEETRKKVANDLSTKVKDAPDSKGINRAIDNYTLSEEGDKEQLKIFKDKLVEKAKERQKSYKKVYEESEHKKLVDSALREFAKDHKPVRFTPFLFGGIYARNFNIFNGVDTSSFAKSFTDTLTRGGSVGIGFNAQVARWWLGMTYSYVDGDNYLSLTSKEYTISTLDTNGNQSLQSEKKKTAFSGKFGKVSTRQLNIDLVKEFPLNDSSHVLTTAYYRGVFSSDTSLLKNYSNLGIGIYFTGKKGKFLGGLYVELPDVSNEIEKAKPVDDRNIRPPFKKLTFGIVTKVSISSIMAFVNRPRTPDE